MQKLAEVCIRRPVFATMIVLALVVVGGASYFRLGVDRFPSVELPTVSVRTELPGASVEEVETQVTQKIEEAVNTVQGIHGAPVAHRPRHEQRHRHLRPQPLRGRGRPGRPREGPERACASCPATSGRRPSRSSTTTRRRSSPWPSPATGACAS